MSYDRIYPNCHSNLKNEAISPVSRPSACPQKPGTVLRVFIPAGTVINLLNLIELSSPSGICVIIRLPFLGKNHLGNIGSFDLGDVFDSVRMAGGSIEVINE